jgi:hypothetical protein
MRCPICRHRALGLLRWFRHSLWQPRWKEDRWVTHCRTCNATLDPSDRDRILRLVLMVLAMFASYALTSQLPLAYRPHGVVNALIGIVVGVLTHYPLASYDCLDAVPVPEARSRKDRPG